MPSAESTFINNLTNSFAKVKSNESNDWQFDSILTAAIIIALSSM